MSLTNGSKRAYLTGTTAHFFDQRVQPRIEAYASAQAQKNEIALRTDGDLAFVWTKDFGHIKCTCNPKTSITESAMSGAPFLTSSTGSQTATVSSDASTNSPEYTLVGMSPHESQYLTVDETIDEKIRSTDEPEWVEQRKLQGTDRDKALAGMALNDSGQEEFLPPLPELISTEDDTGYPVGLGGSEAGCPICRGTGFVDSYRCPQIRRIVLDLREDGLLGESNQIAFNSTMLPVTVELYNNGYVEWSFFFPKYWISAIRLQAYNGNVKVNLPITITGPNGNIVASKEGLEAAKGNVGPYKLSIKNTGDASVIISHIEILLLMAQPLLMNIAPLDAPYSSEWIDPSVELSAELPSSAIVKPGDIITEAKYGRVWRISQCNTNKTSLGSVLGHTVSMRAIQRGEFFATMNLWELK